MIRSPRRAAAIVERVADKHRIEVATLLCARWDRFVRIARAEVAEALRSELLWSHRMIGDYIGCSHPVVIDLLAFHRRFVKRSPLMAQAPDPDGRIRELEAEIARLAGTMLCEQLARKFELPLRCAILLAIVIEAYPRYVRGPALLQLYDEACDHLGYGRRDGATYDLVSKHASDLASGMAKLGLNVPPADLCELKGARVLNSTAALWLHDRCGWPRRSQIEAAREAEQVGMVA